MEAIKTRRALVLQDTIQYYSQDPQGRRCRDGVKCRYSPKSVGKEATSEGCAVGRLLSRELREKLDRDYIGKTVRYAPLFETLPKAVQELGKGFLSMLQDLHDLPFYWDSEGLSDRGKEEVQKIEEDYCI